jgi:tRNA pseudouridine38-40 synthase
MDIRTPTAPFTRQNDLAPGLTRFVCTVAYDGTDFSGWQSQADGNGIQDVLERRLSVIFRAPVRIHGSGRTDAGVHARGQIFHFDAYWEHALESLQNALHTGLPVSIQVTGVKPGRANFHARFSACGKRYTYHIYEGFAPPIETRYCLSTGVRKLDIAKMREAAAALTGVHDFSAFSGRKSDTSETENFVKDLRRLEVVRRGARITITTEASGYLYKMVRRLSGGLIEVGLGKLTTADLIAYREALTSTALVPAAPARGLIMEKVFYRIPTNANTAAYGTTDGTDDAE